MEYLRQIGKTKEEAQLRAAQYTFEDLSAMENWKFALPETAG